jgi:hypothetical protein
MPTALPAVLIPVERVDGCYEQAILTPSLTGLEYPMPVRCLSTLPARFSGRPKCGYCGLSRVRLRCRRPGRLICFGECILGFPSGSRAG